MSDETRFPGDESACCGFCKGERLLRGWRAGAGYEWCRACGALRTVVDRMCPEGWQRPVPANETEEHAIRMAETEADIRADWDARIARDRQRVIDDHEERMRREIDEES